jgi:hypothetical protein
MDGSRPVTTVQGAVMETILPVDGQRISFILSDKFLNFFLLQRLYWVVYYTQSMINISH